MNARQADRTLADLVARGFDLSAIDIDVRPKGAPDYAVTAGCSQCAAVAFNGIATHERGCPNQTRPCRDCRSPTRNLSRVCDDCAADAAWELQHGPEGDDGDESGYMRGGLCFALYIGLWAGALLAVLVTLP